MRTGKGYFDLETLFETVHKLIVRINLIELHTLNEVNTLAMLYGVVVTLTFTRKMDGLNTRFVLLFLLHLLQIMIDIFINVDEIHKKERQCNHRECN